MATGDAPVGWALRQHIARARGQLVGRKRATLATASSSDEKLARAQEMGADHAINYGSADVAKEVRRITEKRGVDVVVNFTGGDTWVKSLRALRLGGRLLTCGATAGSNPQEDIRFIWTFELQIRGSNGWQRDDIHTLLDLAASGELKVPIDRSYSLDDGIEALRSIEERRIIGKVVVNP